jgi:hypothetical protein
MATVNYKYILLRFFAVLLLALITGFKGYSQKYLSDFDSSLLVRDTLRPFLKKFENLRITGYLQPQFQVAQSKGAPSYNGGNFSAFSQNRFMLRRARVRIDYFLLTKDNYPKAVFTFQVDATERGVGLRDVFVKAYGSKYHNFSVTAGMFARPFGYEVNLSSQYREAPERGRMSQILMPSERDLGAMVSYEPIKKGKKHFFKFDVGLFNGQGLSGSTDFDSHKDLISRLFIKPLPIKSWEFSGGLSLLYGGWRQSTKYLYKTASNNTGDKVFAVDSSLANIGDIAPRHYYGADIQIKLNHGWGSTELRNEYWKGSQPGTATSTSNPGTLPEGPTYIRNFDGGFFFFLQHIINNKNQLLIKYDWYDPNVKVEEAEIGKTGTNFTSADVRFSTWGFGFLRQINENLRFVVYYDMVRNEKTQLAGYTEDLEDNILTLRFHYRF